MTNLQPTRAELVEILRQNPSDAEAWYQLALLLDEPDQAIYSLKRVLALEPQHSGAAAKLASLRGTTPEPAPPTAANPQSPGSQSTPSNGGDSDIQKMPVAPSWPQPNHSAVKRNLTQPRAGSVNRPRRKGMPASTLLLLIPLFGCLCLAAIFNRYSGEWMAPAPKLVSALPSSTATIELPTATATTIPTIAPSPTATNSPTVSPTPTETNTPTVSPTPTISETPSKTPTDLPSDTPVPDYGGWKPALVFGAPNDTALYLLSDNEIDLPIVGTTHWQLIVQCSADGDVKLEVGLTGMQVGELVNLQQYAWFSYDNDATLDPTQFDAAKQQAILVGITDSRKGVIFPNSRSQILTLLKHDRLLFSTGVFGISGDPLALFYLQGLAVALKPINNKCHLL